MLVLSRKAGQKIKISDAITITVIAVHGNRVQIGVDAPPEVTIHREEVRARIAAETEASECR